MKTSNKILVGTGLLIALITLILLIALRVLVDRKFVDIERAERSEQTVSQPDPDYEF